MNKLMFYALTAICLTLGACNTKSTKTDDKVSTDPKPVNIKLSELATKKDLHCEMELTANGIIDTTTYQGKIYGFCSPECKAEFLKNPEAELAKK